MFNELFEEIERVDGQELIGTTVYHGTSDKYIYNILKVGLSPRPNKWMAKYAKDSIERYEILKNLPKELFVAEKLESAKMWAQNTADYGGKPIVVAFKIKSSDEIVSVGGEYADEIVLGTKISSDRLRVVYPSDFKVEKVLGKIKKGKDKTKTIRMVNEILKKYDFRVKSGSKTTSRVTVYFEDGYVGTLLLSEFKDAVIEGVDSEFAGKLTGDKDEDRKIFSILQNISEADKKTILEEIDTYLQ